jgi:hypothetical protein
VEQSRWRGLGPARRRSQLGHGLLPPGRRRVGAGGVRHHVHGGGGRLRPPGRPRRRRPQGGHHCQRRRLGRVPGTAGLRCGRERERERGREGERERERERERESQERMVTCDSSSPTRCSRLPYALGRTTGCNGINLESKAMDDYVQFVFTRPVLSSAVSDPFACLFAPSPSHSPSGRVKARRRRLSSSFACPCKAIRLTGRAKAIRLTGRGCITGSKQYCRRATQRLTV